MTSSVMRGDPCTGFVGSLIAQSASNNSFGIPGVGLTDPDLSVVVSGLPTGLSIRTPQKISYPLPPYDSLYSAALQGSAEFSGPVQSTGLATFTNSRTGQSATIVLSANVYPTLFGNMTGFIQLNVNPALYVPFGAVPVGGQSTLSITARNRGASPTTLQEFRTQSLNPGNASFEYIEGLSSCKVGTVLQPGDECTVAIQAGVLPSGNTSRTVGYLFMKDTLYDTIYQTHDIGLVVNN